MQRISDPRLYRAMKARAHTLHKPTSAHLHTHPADVPDVWTPFARVPGWVWAILFAAIVAWWLVVFTDSLGAVSLAMPYFVHVPGTEPETGLPFDTRELAHTASKAMDGRREITFVCSEDESREWRTREYRRFGNEYQEVPWVSNSQQYWGRWDGPLFAHVAIHFTHVSLTKPGMVAYTPSEEFGIQDRQLIVRVGKYLKDFFSDIFSAEEIAGYVATVKSYTAGLSLATSTEDIITAYTGNRLGSCMAHDISDYKVGTHPVSVYGESDLAVAYIGDLDNVRARAIVWPDKKHYCRIYGDETLAVVLKSNGYVQVRDRNLDHGSLDGARIRAIKYKHTYVMPYIDGASSCDLSRDGKWFTLRADHDGEYKCRDADYVDGLPADENERHICERCDNRRDEDESYCQSCLEDRYVCDRCGEDIWDADVNSFDDNVYCENCISRVSHECETCDETISRDDTYCTSCLEHITTCDECSTEYDDRDEDKCPSCPDPEEDEDEDEDTDESEESAPIPDMASVAPTIPLISTPFVRINLFDGTSRNIQAEYVSRHFAVHASPVFQTGYRITHRLTGWYLANVSSVSRGKALCDALERIGGRGWDITETEQCAPDLKRRALEILRLPESSDVSIYMPLEVSL